MKFTSNQLKTVLEKRQTIPVIPQLLLVSAILLLLLGGTANSFLLSSNEATARVVEPTTTKQSPAPALSDPDGFFRNLNLSAEAAYVYDLTTEKVLYSSNHNEQLPLASITKLMTALVAYELLTEDTQVSIDETALRQDGLSDFLTGETFNPRSLSDLVLVSSSNDGAYALAAAAGKQLDNNDPAAAFVQAMNIKAADLGMEQTYFLNPSGLDVSPTEAGSYGSAADVALLMEYIVRTYPSLLRATTKPFITEQSATGYVHEAPNTNYYVDSIPGLLGSKTGYTELAGGNLTVAFNAGLNHPVVVVVLGSNRHSRFTDVLALTDATINYVSQ